MEPTAIFADILEAADELSIDEKETLLEILRHRVVAQRRREIARDIEEAQREFEAGGCIPASPEELVREIVS